MRKFIETLLILVTVFLVGCGDSGPPTTPLNVEEMKEKLIGHSVAAGDKLWFFEKGNKIEISPSSVWGYRYGRTTYLYHFQITSTKDEKWWLSGDIRVEADRETGEIKLIEARTNDSLMVREAIK